MGKKLSAKLAREAEITRCRDCERILVTGRFVPETKATLQQLLQSIYKPYKVYFVHSGNGITRIRVVDESKEGLGVEHNVHMKFKRVLCEMCARKRSGYYESVVQLRGTPEKVLNLANSLERYLEKYDAFFTKVEEKEHGIDIYASDKKATLAILMARHLKWKASFELHGEKRGVRLYRNTYFITL